MFLPAFLYVCSRQINRTTNIHVNKWGAYVSENCYGRLLVPKAPVLFIFVFEGESLQTSCHREEEWRGFGSGYSLHFISVRCTIKFIFSSRVLRALTSFTVLTAVLYVLHPAIFSALSRYRVLYHETTRLFTSSSNFTSNNHLFWNIYFFFAFFDNIIVSRNIFLLSIPSAISLFFLHFQIAFSTWSAISFFYKSRAFRYHR